MMTIERELLNEWVSTYVNHDDLDKVYRETMGFFAQPERDFIGEIQYLTDCLMEAEEKVSKLLAQPEQEPLTATQIDKIVNSQLKEYGQLCDKSDFELFASSIEKAHGIGESDYGF
jgi:hypothetical protein